MKHSSRITKGYDVNDSVVEGSNQNGESTLGLGTNRMVQEPGPIGDEVEERQDNSGSQGHNGISAVWTPPTFRTYRKCCIY